ncbi:MAG: hypothetical protein PHV37_01705 [Candidatus Gastranaerophilales bacterium]|nr:hypothetical protein [Candidatus Gastranaerophilales bacterium]
MKKILLLLLLLSCNIAFADEVKTQKAYINNCYLTTVSVQKEDNVSQQIIVIKNSFLVFVSAKNNKIIEVSK